MTVMSLSRDLRDDFHSDTVLSILNEQRIRGILCDVTIIVEDTKFKAHSNVLAASSLYFKNIFWSHAICISSHVLELDDLKAEVFTEILNYIYSSTVVVRRQETVTDLAAAGKKLGISFLEDLTNRTFCHSPGPYVYCITEKGVVKDEKHEKRPQPEEPAITSGPRITNAFSIVETESSGGGMFSPLDLRASFKKVSDSMRGASLCLGRPDGCHEAEPVRTLAEHSYAVSSVSSAEAAAEAFRGQPESQPASGPPGPPGRTGQENGEAVAQNLMACSKPRALSAAPQDPAPAPEKTPPPPPPGPSVEAPRERSPPPAAALPGSTSPGAEGDVLRPPREDENAPSSSSEVPGPPEAEVPPLVYHCSSCSKSFDSSTLLGAHMQLHKPTQQPLVCRYCNKEFSTPNRLDRHEQICMRSGHIPGPGGNQCFLENYPTLGRSRASFAGPGSLLPGSRIGDFPGPGSTLPEMDHLVKLVNGQMLYSCTVCKRSYVTLSSLRRHANVHSWRRTYPCHYCNKVFALAEYRTRHEIWHTGERRYQCIFCLETFMTYYILKNHQKSFHAIDHRLSIGKKTANGGLKPSVYPYKLYRLLPMKCKRAPYKSYRSASYENARESRRAGEPAAGPYAVQNPRSSELPALSFPDGVHPVTHGPAAPLDRAAGQNRPTSASIRSAEGSAWGGETLKADLDSNFYPKEVSLPFPENAVGSSLPAGGMPALSLSHGSENSASVISYGGPAPSVIVHSSQFSSVIVHSGTAAALPGGGGNHRAPPGPAVGQAAKEDSKPEPDRAGRAGSRHRGMKERKKAAPRDRGDVPEESRSAAADPGGGPLSKATSASKETGGKIETYIAKPALPGTSTNSNVAPLCQITVKIGNEAIVKRHILGSKLFYKRGRRPKAQAQEEEEEALPQEGGDPDPRGDSPLDLCQSECMDMSEMFDEASDQDSTDKPWRPYYNYKPKKKSRQLRKTRKANWRKEHTGGRSPGARYKYPAELDCAVGKAPPEKAFEEEEEDENKEMPKLQCELCDGGDKAPGTGSPGRPHRHLTARPYACEFCAKQFQNPSTLKMHMRCHTGEKPYPCKTCGRCFSVQGNLQKHERIHLGVKEFICRYCSKAFTLNETLKIHERIHTGEKRYHCQFCFQSFLYLSTKRNHEQRHVREHAGKGFACFQCPKICKTAAALGMHQKKHLFRSPSPQERMEGNGYHENSAPLENPHFMDSEDSDQKDHLQTMVGNVL